MKKNKYILIIVIILAAIAAFLWFSRSSGTISPKMMDFAVKDTSNITKVFLVNKKNKSVLLEKVNLGEWRMNGKYKVRKSGIDMLMETMLKVSPKTPVPKSAHNSVVRMLAASSIKVEIYQEVYRIDMFGLKLFPHEKLTKTYFVGSPSADNMGTFMLMKGASIPFVVHILNFRGFLGTRYSTIESDWRDHTVFNTKLSDIKSITMEVPENPAESFKVENEGKSPKVYDYPTGTQIEGYDTIFLLNFMLAFSDLRFEAILNPDVTPQRIDSIRNSTPLFILTVEDKKSKTTQLKAFPRPNTEEKVNNFGELYVYDHNRLYGIANDSEELLMIQYYVFDKVFLGKSDFKLEN